MNDFRSVCGTCDGFRREPDGTVWLTKEMPDLEAILDLTMTRTRPRELRWIPRFSTDPLNTHVGKLKDYHQGQTVVLLGKGPSLERWLAAPRFPKGSHFVVGINEAGLTYRCRYVFALDDAVFLRLGKLPLETVVAVEPKRVVSAPFPRKLIWEWGVHVKPGYATAPAALSVLRFMGVRRFLMVGFDGYDGGAEYASVLGLPPRDNDSYEPINRQFDELALQYDWYHRQGVA